jgi:hypothetical protein
MFKRTNSLIFLIIFVGTIGSGIAQTADTLKVHVLQGNGAVNNIATGNITTPVVEVRDENDAPVEGADVVFHLPTTGPGGIFGDQKFVFTTKTNSQGQARCARFKPGSQVGRFEITVAVSSAGRTGHVVVHQSNSETDFAVEAQHTSTLKRKKWWLIGAGLTGGAVAGIVIATHGGSTSSVSSSYTISAGAISFGPPH